MFFIGYDEFVTAFESYDIAVDRSEESYGHTWYDRDESTGALETYKFIPTTADGDIYLTVNSYPLSTIPLSCFTGSL